MGYYTNFKLNLIDTETGDYISPNSEIYKKIRETFNATFETEKDSVFNCLVKVGCEWKWYSWKEDMKIIAELFPTYALNWKAKEKTVKIGG